LATAVNETTRGFTREAVEALSAARNEPEWVRAQRLAAWETYERIPMPTLRDEEWRRTDLKGLKMDAVIPYGPALDERGIPEAIADVLENPEQRGGLFIQHDGTTIHTEIAESLRAQGVIIADLETALREHEDLIRPHFMTKAVTAETNKFAALHAAFHNGGTFVYVPKGVQVETPIHTIYWATTPHLGAFPHTLIVVDDGASLNFVDEYASAEMEGVQGFASTVVELLVGAGAHLEYANLQRWNRTTYSFHTQRLLQERDSTIKTINVGLGGQLSKYNIDTVLQGEGTHARILNLTFADKKQLFSYETLQDHVKGNSISDLLFKFGLRDTARTVYSGLIHVRPHAQKSNAYQRNGNLLLSDRARADSIPKLEIEANDVRCTHGATLGQIDPNQIFYLMARGLPRRDAERLLAEGFFAQVEDELTMPALADRLRDAIDKKLAGTGY
jgi:Fe-S cluster assembly protein SufD